MSDLVRNYPVIFLPLQNNVEQSFGKDDNELKRIYTILNSLRGMYYGGTPPTSPNVGDKWHDSTTNIVKQWNGSTWAVFLESTSQLTSVLNEALGAPIASASTINLTTATGNFLHVTGATTITAVTLGAGMRREIIFDGILTLTHHATNNNLPGGANITTAVGDRASYYSDGTTVYCNDYQRADGTAVVFSGFVGFTNKKAAVTSNTALTVTADYGVLINSSGRTKIFSTISLTLGTGTTGVNALDRGTVGNSKWYQILCIGKEDGTKAGLLVEEANIASPILPNGYTYSYHVGWVKTHSDGTLLRTKQVGNRTQYVVTPATNTINLPIMASGVLGNVSTPTWSAVSVSNFVPPTASVISGTVFNATSSTTVLLSPNNNYGSQTSTTNPPICRVDCNSGGNTSYALYNFLLESTNIYISSNSVSGGVNCSGWEDNL